MLTIILSTFHVKILLDVANENKIKDFKHKVIMPKSAFGIYAEKGENRPNSPLTKFMPIGRVNHARLPKGLKTPGVIQTNLPLRQCQNEKSFN
jgi:hypothetical protein